MMTVQLLSVDCEELKMGITELFVLAIGLSMDAFAVSICKGLSLGKISWKHMCIAGTDAADRVFSGKLFHRHGYEVFTLDRLCSSGVYWGEYDPGVKE